MDINKTYKGVFWIPSEPENHKNGLLKFLNETAFVDLFDSFDKDPLNIKTKRRDKICCIHGILENQKCCILNNCELRISNAFGIIETLINFDYLYYSSNRDLISKNLDFEKIEFKLDSLFHWVGHTSIESVIQPDGNYGLNYKKTDLVDILFSNESYSLKINHITSLPLITNKKKITVEQDTTLILKSNSNHSITEFYAFLDKIHDLFILLNADKVELDSTLQFTTNTNEKYFFCYNNLKRFRNTKRFSKHECGNLFTLSSLRKKIDLNSFFNYWFSMYTDYYYPIELLTKCLSDISMNIQHKFINLVYSLEIIYQKDSNSKLIGEYLNKNDQKLITKIEELGLKDKNTINQIKSRLSKNYRLKEKITALLEPLESTIQNLFKQELTDFVEIIVNTRNYLAHESNKIPRLEIEEFYDYNLKLEAIILTIFFNKLGLQLKDIELKVKMHDRFQKVTDIIE